MLRNTEASWGSMARLFHWVLAALIIGVFAYGLWMKGLPREVRGYHYSIHASIGISLLALMVLRVLWRIANPTPKPPIGAQAWEINAARLGHLALYGTVFGAAIAGWFLAGSGRASLDYYLFGVIAMPNMLGTNSPYHGTLEEAHELFAYAVIALTVAHIASALWHERVKRDGVLARMVSGKPSTTV